MAGWGDKEAFAMVFFFSAFLGKRSENKRGMLKSEEDWVKGKKKENKNVWSGAISMAQSKFESSIKKSNLTTLEGDKELNIDWNTSKSSLCNKNA